MFFLVISPCVEPDGHDVFVVGQLLFDQPHETRLASSPFPEHAYSKRSPSVGGRGCESASVCLEAEPVNVTLLGFADGLVRDQADLHGLSEFCVSFTTSLPLASLKCASA